MANGNGGWKTWVAGIVGTLLAAGILGNVAHTIATAGEQGEMRVQVRVNAETSAANTEAVKPIPVMAEQIKDIKEDVGDIKDEMERNKQEILDAIKEK